MNLDQGLADSKPSSSLSRSVTEVYFGDTRIAKICNHPASECLFAVCDKDAIIKLVKNLSIIPEKKM